ncbi:MAG: hypothetical protein ACYC4P_11605 [Thermoanaerobaculia bacterium]
MSDLTDQVDRWEAARASFVTGLTDVLVAVSVMKDAHLRAQGLAAAAGTPVGTIDPSEGSSALNFQSAINEAFVAAATANGATHEWFRFHFWESLKVPTAPTV